MRKHKNPALPQYVSLLDLFGRSGDGDLDRAHDVALVRPVGRHRGGNDREPRLDDSRAGHRRVRGHHALAW